MHAQSTSELENYNKSKDYFSGISYYNEHDSVFKNDRYANYLLGEMGLKSERWETARKGYETAIRLCSPTPNMNFHEQLYSDDNFIYWASYDGLGVVYYNLGDKQKSLSALEEADKWLQYVIVSSADRVSHFFNLACAYSINNKFEKAVVALKEVLILNPMYISKIRKEHDFNSMKDYQPFKDLLLEK
jgi:tetratricopeptide (TPR) repeat protein